MKKFVFPALAAAWGLVLGSFAGVPAADAGEIVIKFSHVSAQAGHPKGEAAALFAKRVNERMKGRVRIDVFPDARLHDDDKVLAAMLAGDVQLAAPSLSKFERFTLKYRVFDLPFMFKDIEAVDRFQNSPTGEKLKNAMSGQGLKGLAFWHNGMKQLSARKPLIAPADARGLKFRIQASDVLRAQFEALGASTRKMAFKKVYGALRTGAVDGQENTWSNIFTEKFHEVQDGITETNHGIVDYLVVTPAGFWDGLPPGIRGGLERILTEVTAERNAISSKINQAAKGKIIAAGTKVRRLTPAQRRQWVAAIKPVWSKFEKDIGGDIIAAAVAANNPPGK